MNQIQLRRQLAAHPSPVLRRFHGAMEATLKGIVLEERLQEARKDVRPNDLKRIPALVPILALLLAAVAAAALLHPQVFEALFGHTPANAPRLAWPNPPSETVGGVEMASVRAEGCSPLLPQKGMAVFSLDASARKGVIAWHPKRSAFFDGITARVSEAVFTPIALYGYPCAKRYPKER